MDPFVYTAQPGRVIFGTGTLARLEAEAERLGLRRVLVLATPGQVARAEAAVRALGGRAASRFAEAAMHTPVTVTERAMAAVREARADGVVAIGGGSAIGLGKAVALRTDLPQVAIPTTYAGSEMTPVLGETADGVKTTRSDPRILPELVIYDVDLTLGLPPHVTATSGMNAIAHGVEALYAREGNPVVSMLAEEGIRTLAQSLPGLMRSPRDGEGRAQALYGAWLCAICLGSAGMALHHRLCHTLGGSFGLPHAETHAAVLPHAVRYNAPAAGDAMARLARALDTQDPALALYRLAQSLGATMALGALGMPETGIGRAADLALAAPYWNPRPVEREGLLRLLTAAWAGEAP